MSAPNGQPLIPEQQARRLTQVMVTHVETAESGREVVLRMVTTTGSETYSMPALSAKEVSDNIRAASMGIATA